MSKLFASKTNRQGDMYVACTKSTASAIHRPGRSGGPRRSGGPQRSGGHECDSMTETLQPKRSGGSERSGGHKCDSMTKTKLQNSVEEAWKGGCRRSHLFGITYFACALPVSQRVLPLKLMLRTLVGDSRALLFQLQIGMLHSLARTSS